MDQMHSKIKYPFVSLRLPTLLGVYGVREGDCPTVPLRDLGANLKTYQVGAHFEALDEGVLLVPLHSKYTQVLRFNLIVQV